MEEVPVENFGKCGENTWQTSIGMQSQGNTQMPRPTIRGQREADVPRKSFM